MTSNLKFAEIKKKIKIAKTHNDWRLIDDLYKEPDALLKRTADTVRDHAGAAVKLGDLPRAATMMRKSLRMDPKNIETKVQLSSIYISQRRIKEADKLLKEVLDANPDHVPAIISFVQCIGFNPEIENKEAVHDNICRDAKMLVEHGLKCESKNAILWHQLASILGNNKDNIEAASDAFSKSLKIDPNSASTLINFGKFKRLNADLLSAEKFLLKACELQPHNADNNFSLALCYLSMEDLESTLKWLDSALMIDPNYVAAEVYKAFVYFLQGKMRKGWEQYEKRLQLEAFKGLNYGRPRWDGSKLKKETILLLREQGLGDNIQFIRYAKKIVKKGGTVVVSTRKELETLFKSLDGVSLVTSGIPEPKHFYRYCPLMSLPYVFKTDQKSIPSTTPYLFPEKNLVNVWSHKLKKYPGLRVGLTWRGNRSFTNDRFRSSSLKEVSELLSLKNITFFSLMVDLLEEEQLPKNIVNLGKDFSDFADTAAAIKNLDLVISVDTAVCHLAGAVGQPVWTMLPKSCDFRWGLKGKKTKWYPTMTLYRQKVFGSWDNVYKEMQSDLKKLCG